MKQTWRGIKQHYEKNMDGQKTLLKNMKGIKQHYENLDAHKTTL